LSLLNRIIVEEGIQNIFHLAAQVEVGVARDYPYLTMETNIRGTYTLLESINSSPNKIESIIIASSDKAYGSYPENKLPYKENYPLRAENPYDVSKACADMISKTFSKRPFRLPILVTRFSNIYGPGQLNFSALIPDCIRTALGYGKFIPRTNGEHYRDFLFIDDVVNLYLKMSKKVSETNSLRGEVFNAGFNKPVNIKSLIFKIIKIVRGDKFFNEYKKTLSFPKSTPDGEILMQQMDFNKVEKHFKWKPQIELDQGIKISAEWYKSYLKKYYKK
jgi:CDP-glucose 4,6-dehydratase